MHTNILLALFDFSHVYTHIEMSCVDMNSGGLFLMGQIDPMIWMSYLSFIRCYHGYDIFNMIDSV